MTSSCPWKNALENNDIVGVSRAFEACRVTDMSKTELKELFSATFCLVGILSDWEKKHLEACFHLAKQGEDYLCLLSLQA